MQKREETDEKSQFYCVFLIFLVEFCYICAKMCYKKIKLSHGMRQQDCIFANETINISLMKILFSPEFSGHVYIGLNEQQPELMDTMEGHGDRFPMSPWHYSEDIVKTVMEHTDKFYIRAERYAGQYEKVKRQTGWTTVEIGFQPVCRFTFSYRPAYRSARM